MNVVIAGASGFVGTKLVPVLLERGHRVHCGSRRPEAAAQKWPEWSWVRLDLDDEASLGPALNDCDALVYLVHGLASDAPDLHAREQQAAQRTLAAASAAGVSRIVYLGAPEPVDGASPHLIARIDTGKTLRGADVSTVELRASMIIGAGGESWRICRDLALRLPIMVAPAWLSSRTEPVFIDDVVQALAHAIVDPVSGSHVFDIPGPEILTAQAILERVAAQAGMRPVIVPVPLLTPRLSSFWLQFVTQARYRVARQLVDGLTVDLLATGQAYWPRVPSMQRTPFDDAVKRALKDAKPAEGFERVVEGVARRVARRAKISG
ncbi:MAG: NAD(P)H-binding protein [Myxococcota bacterium]